MGCAWAAVFLVWCSLLCCCMAAANERGALQPATGSPGASAAIRVHWRGNGRAVWPPCGRCSRLLPPRRCSSGDCARRSQRPQLRGARRHPFAAGLMLAVTTNAYLAQQLHLLLMASVEVRHVSRQAAARFASPLAKRQGDRRCAILDGMLNATYACFGCQIASRPPLEQNYGRS
jgi:hypothetical protein